MAENNQDQNQNQTPSAGRGWQTEKQNSKERCLKSAQSKGMKKGLFPFK